MRRFLLNSCRRSHSAYLTPPQPHPSRAAHASSSDPYTQLEAAWLRYVGQDAISRLRSLVTPHRVLTVSGDQLIGKSTLAARLASALGGDKRSAGQLFRDEAARREISVPELSRRAMDNPTIDGHKQHHPHNSQRATLPAALSR